MDEDSKYVLDSSTQFLFLFLLCLFHMLAAILSAFLVLICFNGLLFSLIDAFSPFSTQFSQPFPLLSNLNRISSPATIANSLKKVMFLFRLFSGSLNLFQTSKLRNLDASKFS